MLDFSTLAHGTFTPDDWAKLRALMLESSDEKIMSIARPYAEWCDARERLRAAVQQIQTTVKTLDTDDLQALSEAAQRVVIDAEDILARVEAMRTIESS